MWGQTPAAPAPHLLSDSERRPALSPRGSRCATHSPRLRRCARPGARICSRGPGGVPAAGRWHTWWVPIEWPVLSHVPTLSHWTLTPTCKVRGAGALSRRGSRGLGPRILGTWVLGELHLPFPIIYQPPLPHREARCLELRSAWGSAQMQPRDKRGGPFGQQSVSVSLVSPLPPSPVCSSPPSPVFI